MPLAKGVVHCMCTKLEALEKAWDEEHGEGTFVGSPAWRATLDRSWEDGVCLLGYEHLESCVFTPVGRARKERKAS